MRSSWPRRCLSFLGVFSFAVAGWGVLPAAGTDAAAGAVYTMTNAVAGNAVIVFIRASDGMLSPGGTFSTGGRGSGGGLGNQGGLVLSRDGRWLYVVNAGSNDLSAFAVVPGGLRLADRVPSGGERPISVTERGGLIYVLNAGGTGNITGFVRESGDRGRLQPLPASTQPLSGPATDPAQIAFNRGGTILAVTEKATNLIDLYTVDGGGLPVGPNVQSSAGMTPFGFAFDRRGRLVVSEAFGGAPDASAVSSYRVAADGDLTVISGSVPTTETAACWIVITPDNRFAYTTNTGSSSISGYRIDPAGRLTLLDPDGRTGETGEGSAPIDMALTVDGVFLYVLNSGFGQVGTFRVHANGSLEALPGIGGLPLSANGLAAR